MEALYRVSIIIFSLLVLAFLQPVAAVWQYGLSMQPVTDRYDSPEMTTQGVSWSASISNDGPSLMLAAKTGDGWEAHLGWIYNGYDKALVLSCPGGSSIGKLDPGEFGFFYEVYHDGQCMIATILNKPTDWLPSDPIYYASAVYTDKGEFSFQIQNMGRSSSLGTSVCGVNVGETYTSRVGAIFEAENIATDFDSLYTDHISLWAQVLSTGRRNSGNTYAYDSGSPSSIKIYIYSANDAELGFRRGYHYTNNQLL